MKMFRKVGPSLEDYVFPPGLVLFSLTRNKQREISNQTRSLIFEYDGRKRNRMDAPRQKYLGYRENIS
jgi:hypothetical protein